jgi:hypothetical protein
MKRPGFPWPRFIISLPRYMEPDDLSSKFNEGRLSLNRQKVNVEQMPDTGLSVQNIVGGASVLRGGNYAISSWMGVMERTAGQRSGTVAS